MVGSYSYDLIGKADVDLRVYAKNKPDVGVIADFVAEYIKKDHVIKTSLVNYTKFSPLYSWPIAGGVWLGFKINIDGELVNIDIWFMRREDDPQDEFATKMPKDWYKNLTKQQRETIIYLKALSRAGELEREHMSTEICRAVVLGKVASVKDLNIWAETNNI